MSSNVTKSWAATPRAICSICVARHSAITQFIVGRKYIAIKDSFEDGIEKGRTYECIGIAKQTYHTFFVEFKLNDGDSNAYACSALLSKFDPGNFVSGELTREQKVQLAIDACRNHGVTNEEELKRFLEE